MAIKKEVIKLDLNGNEICRYKSIREASINEHISEDKIYKVVNGKQKYADGWVFKKSGVLTNVVDKIGTGDYKCPYCERKFESYNGLCKHVIRQKSHGNISKEQLLTDYKYNGIRPTCACGCGEYTSIDPKGEYHFCEYVFGHGIRVHNNWGHNKLAQEKSAETRRKQYKEGTRIQWNKGCSWNDLYDENTQEYLRNNLKDKLNERIENGKFSLSSMIENEFIDYCITPLKIEFKKQFYIKEINQFCDIYISKLNTIIEFDGDFWHCNPSLFPNGPVYEYQIKHSKKDKIKNEYCLKNGINLIRIWESDYKHNKDKIKEKIKNILFNDDTIKRNEIYEFCRNLIGKNAIIQRDRNLIKPYELDIYIPSLKTAIEYNGLRWHSEKFGKDRNYHLNKLNKCREQGIKLIQIFEDEYLNHKDIVLNKIKHLLKTDTSLPKIMGRKCIIETIDYKEAQKFLEKYHIQGFARSTVYLGAFYNAELVAVMSFRKEHNNSNEWELTRFASNYNYVCQGIGGKLFSSFIKYFDASCIKSFADRRWTINEENNIYIKLGFYFDGYTNPEYRYFKENDGIIRQHKFGFRKGRLNKKYGLPLSMTESEMTEKLGYSKIYDCGLIKYMWTKKEEP